MNCPECGHVNESGIGYCANPACGALLTQVPQPAPRPAAAPAPRPGALPAAATSSPLSLRNPAKLVLPVAAVLALVLALAAAWMVRVARDNDDPGQPAVQEHRDWTWRIVPTGVPSSAPAVAPEVVITLTPAPIQTTKPAPKLSTKSPPAPAPPPPPPPPATTVSASGACDPDAPVGWGVRVNSVSVNNATSGISSAYVSYSASGVDEPPEGGPNANGTAYLSVSGSSASGNFPDHRWEFLGGSGATWSVRVTLNNGNSYTSPSYWTSSC